MFKTLGIGAVVGFTLGILALTFIGVPFVLPSYLKVRGDLLQAEADLKAHAASFDDSEGLRGAETDQCRVAVQEERDYWSARIPEILARGERFDAAPTDEPENDETPLSGHEVGLCGGFEFVSAGQLHQPADRAGADTSSDEPRPADLREP